MGNYDVLFKVADNSSPEDEVDTLSNKTPVNREEIKASRNGTATKANKEDDSIPQSPVTYSAILAKYRNDTHKIIINNGKKSRHIPNKLAHKDISDESRKDDPSIFQITIKKSGESKPLVTFNKRFCKHCKNELDKSAGQKPTKVIFMLGPSDAGKTVFITALFETLSKSSGYVLPATESGAQHSMTINASAYVHNNKAMSNSFETMRKELFNTLGESEYALIPQTTQNIHDPLTLNMKLRLYKESKNDGVLLYLRDVPGEWITNELEFRPEYDKFISELPGADGFIMIIDPYTFEDSYELFKREDDNPERQAKLRRKCAEKSDYIRKMKERFAIDIGHIIDENKPTAVVITKGDHVLCKENAGRLRARGVADLTTFDENQQASLDKDYFDEVNKDMKLILQKLAPEALGMLDFNFENKSYSLVSSFSRDVPFVANKIVVDGVERDCLNVKYAEPWRIAEPIIQLLMYMEIIPKFHTVSLRTKAETRGEYKKRNADYINMINAWGTENCTSWEGYNAKVDKLLDESEVRGRGFWGG